MCVGSDRIAERDDPQRASTARDTDHRASRCFELFDPLAEIDEIDAALGEEPGVSNEDFVTADARNNAFPRYRLKRLHLRWGYSTIERRLEHGLCERMLG